MTRRPATRKKDIFIIGGESLLMDEYLFRQFVEANNPDYPRKGNDDFPLDYPDDSKTLAASKKLRLYNGFRLYANPTKERLAACEPDKYYFIMDLFRVKHDYGRPESKERFPDYDAFFEDYYGGLFRFLATHPETSWGTVTGEADTCCAWPKECFRTKEEAYKFWKETFFGLKEGSNKPNFYACLKKHGIDYRTSNLLVQCGMLWSIHHYYDWGFRFVWLERGCGLSNVQLGAAFLRGAARQYDGGLWGFDFSTHHPHRNQCTWYDKEGRRRGGWTESLTIRSWMTGFLAGAHFVHEETSNLTHWVFDEQGNVELSKTGRLAQRFADFTLRNHPQRGEPFAPIGLVLNFRHGYDARHSIVLRQPYVWGGRMPLRSEDWNIGNLLDFFFPDHSLAWGMFDEALNPSVPWKSQWEYLEMLKNGHDMRPYEAGHLVNSAFGDCLDVLVDTADEKALSRYPVLFLGGNPDYAGKKSSAFEQYLQKGGILIGSYDQLPEEILRGAGVKKTGGNWDYDLTVCAACGREFGGDRYGYHFLTVPRGTVLGRTHDSIPLAWEIPYGKGTLVLTAVAFSQDIPGKRILPLFAHLFEKYVRRELLVCAGPEPLQLTVNRGDGFLLVGVFNNGATPWRGSITVNAGAGKMVERIEELWYESEVFTGKCALPFSFADTIAPFDFKIYRIALNA